MKQYWKQHWFEYVLSAGLVGLAAAALTLLFGYSFSTNDDAMLRSIVSGSYTGSPEAHLVYIMYPLGWIGQRLYMLLPRVYWYDMFMTVTHYLCWFLVIGRIGAQFQSKKGKLVAVLVSFAGILLLDAPYVVMHQYTILAAWFAGVAILFLLTSKEQKGFAFWSDRMVCLVFLVLCLWLRKQVFILALPVGAMILVLEFLRDAKQLKERMVLWGKIIFIAVFAVLTVSSFVVEWKAYESPEWQEFLAYNEARTDIYDYYTVPSYTEGGSFWEEADISFADYLAIDLYNSELVEELSLTNMQTLAQIAKEQWEAGYGLKSTVRIMIEAVVREVLQNPVQPMGILLTILLLCTVIRCVIKDEKKEIIGITFLYVFLGAVVGYFSWRTRFPERVSYGLYLMAAAFLTGILTMSLSGKSEEEEPSEEKKCFGKFWVSLAIICSVFFVAGAGLYRFREMKEKNQAIQINYADWVAINDYFTQYPEYKFCIDTYSFVFTTEKMFAADAEAASVLRLGTWVQESPLQLKRYERNGLEGTLATQAENEGFCFVQAAERGKEWLSQRWFEKGFDAEPKVIDTIVTPSGHKFKVMQPIKKVE